MNYNIEKETDYSFDNAVERVVNLMEEEGYKILTNIDMHTILKEELDVDFNKYKILGAFNASETYAALDVEINIGTILPCNIIVREVKQGKTEVAAIDPLILTMAIENPDLDGVALQSYERLEKIIDKV